MFRPRNTARATIKEDKVKVFFNLLTEAAQKILIDIDTIPDIPNGKYSQLFGNRTFDEYLQYLGPSGIGLLNAEQAKNKFGEKSKSPKFFHYFLQEFNRLRTIKSQSSEDQANFSLAQNPGEPSVKDACKRDKKPGETLSLLSGGDGRYNNDITGTIDVGDMQFSYSETVGTSLRRTQEDSFIIGAANSKFSDSAAAPELLRQEFQRLGKSISDLDYDIEDGSTAILAHYSTDQKLTIANAGDARAVLFIKRKLPDGKFKIEAIRATNDNEPLDVFEIARINALKGYVTENNRVNDELMVARSFGDNGVIGTDPDYSGLISFDPDIYQYDIAKIAAEAGPEAEVFLLTSCDGLYDHGKGNEVTYASIMQDWFNDTELQERWSGNISEYLRDCAIYLQSDDNITVTWANITKAPTQAVVVGVFDGHGGNPQDLTNAVTSRTLALEMGNSLLDPDKPKVVHAVAGKSAISELKTLNEKEAQTEKERIASLQPIATPPIFSSAASALPTSTAPASSKAPVASSPASASTRSTSSQPAKLSLGKRLKALLNRSPSRNSSNIASSTSSPSAPVSTPPLMIPSQIISVGVGGASLNPTSSKAPVASSPTLASIRVSPSALAPSVATSISAASKSTSAIAPSSLTSAAPSAAMISTPPVTSPSSTIAASGSGYTTPTSTAPKSTSIIVSSQTNTYFAPSLKKLANNSVAITDTIPSPSNTVKTIDCFPLTLRPYVKEDLLETYITKVEEKEGATSANRRALLKLTILLEVGFSKEEIFASAIKDGTKIIIGKQLLSETFTALNLPTEYIKKAQETFQGGISINPADIGALFGDRRVVERSDEDEFHNLVNSLNNPQTRKSIYKNYFDDGGIFDKIKARKEALSGANTKTQIGQIINRTSINHGNVL